MTYRIPLPDGGHADDLDIVEPNSTAVQRFLRRDGLAAYEPPTVATVLTLFDDFDDGFTFFDVGANMGLYALLCAALFEPGSVQAFEPTPDTAATLRKIVKANELDIDVLEAAVGDNTGRANLHLSAKSDASNSMVDGFKESHDDVEVETVRLDDHVVRSKREPDIMKIDVETFEPAVLAGATTTIERARPFIVIEVLNRQGHDHGAEISAAMERYGYSYYELSAAPSWEPRPVVSGNARSPHKDWLLAPEPLDAGFGDRWESWRSRVDECGPDRNSRVPAFRSVGVAMKRGGLSEVVATGRRYLAARRRERVPPTN
jgi:FkbM family methyltransferase